MNSVQTQGSSATIIAFLAGILAGKGVFGFDTATWITVLGAVFGAGSAIWAAVAARKTAIVTQVANMPEVKEVKLDASVPGTVELNQATPANVKVAA